MKEFRKPDLNAPRFRRTWTAINFWNLTLALKKKYPGKYNHIKQKDFKRVIEAHHQNIQEAVIKGFDEVQLPKMVGILRIVSFKSKRKEAINYKLSKETGKVVKHRNLHTDGYMAKLQYCNSHRSASVLNRELWEFLPVRQFTRTIAKKYPENWKNYKVSSGKASKHALKRDLEKREYAEAREKESLKTYNEFDLN